MKNNLIIGAGGHGKVIADIMLCQGINVLGFLDDNPSLLGQHILDLPILGSGEHWMEFNPDGLIVGIGDNAIRRKVVNHLEKGEVPSLDIGTAPAGNYRKISRIGCWDCCDGWSNY